MKQICIKLIEFYQKLPLFTHSMCRFTPTCSEYTKEAIQEYGVCEGILFGIKRIIRCNPLNKNQGYDPVPKRKQVKK